ncbi:MAG TPA: sporulation protein YabP [Clostridiaceae bacterium]|nr:sporulation protein YabP [Clostridiaceae bacterium]
MIDERRQNSINVIQNIVLENRERLNVTGINDILSFDDQVVILSTDLGMLTVKGNELKINKLNIDESEVKIEGNISSMSYSQNSEESKGESFFSKIFK